MQPSRDRRTDALRLGAQPKRCHWVFGCFLIVVTFIAYLPALHGEFVWDDASWTTNLYGLFQNASGLHLMWFQPTVLQQYYPLTGTTFWLDYQLWKFWTLPYHVENVLLHAVAALLFWRLLVRLRVPGAWLAAALFALHPVMVESAAWITERKNVLSLVLYLAAFLAYLRYANSVASDEDSAPPATRHPSLFYFIGLVLFLGALLAKTTTFALPATILLVVWWKRGCIRWRADVLPVLPFFAMAIGLCAVTAWLEKNHVGAQGTDFGLTFPQRFLVAGRVFWFYIGKLFWPGGLCFVYPRWEPHPGLWWQWLYPVTAAGTLLAVWLARGRIGRGPAAALFYYVGTLFPVLGFMNAYFMRYSFVCDHWVYLSSLGIFALVAGLLLQAAEKTHLPGLVCGFAVVVLPMAAILTWRQAASYRNMETLWQTTLEQNPDCWLAQNNLGAMYFAEGMPVDAERFYRQALKLNPGYAEAYSNLGTALAAQGKFAEATGDFDRALQLKPDYAEGHYNLGLALASQGKWAEALQQYEQAVALKPDYVDAINNSGTALIMLRKPADAIAKFNRVLEIQPDFAGAHFNLGLTLAGLGKPADAMVQFEQALALATAQGNPRLAAAIRSRMETLPADVRPSPGP